MATSFSEPKLKRFPDPAALAGARQPDAELPVHPGGELVPAGDARHGPQGAVLPHRPRAAAGRGPGWPPRQDPSAAARPGSWACLPPTPRASPSTVRSGSAPAIAAGTDVTLQRSTASCTPQPPSCAACPGCARPCASARWDGRAWPAATGPISTCACCFRREPLSLAAGQPAPAASAHACLPRPHPARSLRLRATRASAPLRPARTPAGPARPRRPAAQRSIHVAPYPWP